MSNTSWHIIGAGSIGCLWAAQFCQSGQLPTLIVRNETVRSHTHYQKLTITTLDNQELSWTIPVASPETLQQQITHLLVCTKAQDALNAMQSVCHQLSPDADIVLMQNGMGSQQEVASHFSQHSVWAASTTEGAWMKAPFHVCHAGTGQTWIGQLTDHTESNHLDIINQLPLAVQFTDNIERKLWEKLSINCAINGLTALFDCRNGALIMDESYKRRLTHLVDEVLTVTGKLNIQFPSSLHETVYTVCAKTAMNHSSTCADARSRRKTELQYINGFLIKEAEKLGIAVPEHQKLLSELAEKGVQW